MLAYSGSGSDAADIQLVDAAIHPVERIEKAREISLEEQQIIKESDS